MQSSLSREIAALSAEFPWEGGLENLPQTSAIS